jgi:hypothetical protein
MTFSYSQPVAGVFANPKDEVRFLLRDTVNDPEISISDEEIEFLLATYDGEIYLAAAQGAMTLAMAHSVQATVTQRTIGDMSLSLQHADSAEDYKMLSAFLRKGKIGNSFRPFFVETVEQFKLEQFDNFNSY